MNDTFLHIIGAFQKTFSEIFCATDNVFRSILMRTKLEIWGGLGGIRGKRKIPNSSCWNGEIFLWVL
jgi:hypothetical protein